MPSRTAPANNEQFEELQQIIELQQTVVVADLSVKELMELICDRTQLLTHAEGAVIEMAEGDEMVYTAGSGSLKSMVGVRLKIASSLSGLSVRTNQILQCENSETDPRVDREACRRVGAISMICVPLRHKNKAIGVLKVTSPKAYAFNQKCVDLLQLLAGLLSASIAQAAETAEKNRAFELLKASEAQSREAAQMKAEFLANMSHEIRTPINAVMGMANLLMDTSLQNEQKQYTEIIRTSADTLLTLINDILDFSKIEANKMRLETVDFDLKQVMEDIYRILAHMAEKKGLAFNYSIDPSLPRHVMGDPSRVRQVLCNLANNAIKFTSQGSVHMHVRGEKKADRQWQLRFEVTDTGIGISQEGLTRMFQPFSQVDTSTTRKYGGTGLGLSICKQLVELMNGRIGVHSEEGQGSTFWFSLDVPESNVAPIHRQDVIQVAGPGQKLRFLVAEDNSVNQMIVSKMLEKLGHGATIVANGLEAIEALKLAPYDMVLMDCQMPEMDGYEATRQIRLLKIGFQAIPIIAMTAHAMAGDREKCLACGMNDYITKPTQITDLQAAIDRCTSQVSLRKTL